MGNVVEAYFGYGGNVHADKYIRKAIEVASPNRVEVRISYISETNHVGPVLFTFPCKKTAKKFRTEAKKIRSGGDLYMLDGVRFTELDREAMHAPQSPAGTEALERVQSIWTPKMIEAAEPRSCRGRVEPPVLENADLTTAQSAFQGRAVADQEYSQGPFNAVGKLRFTGVDWRSCTGVSPYYGSAWLIHPRIIMTVAHNLYEANCRSESENLVFIAGHGGPNEQEYPVIDWKVVSNFIMDPQFQRPNPSAFNDVGVAILDRPADSIFGIVPAVTDGSIQPSQIRMLGYPGNKDNGNKMWMCDGSFLPQQSDSFQFSMSCDFSGGASGGPWVVNTPTGWQAIGLQSGERPGSIGYSGRLGQQAKDLIQWANSVIGSLV